MAVAVAHCDSVIHIDIAKLKLNVGAAIFSSVLLLRLPLLLVLDLI